MRPRQFAPFILVSAILGGALLAPLHRILAALWRFGTSLYILANLAASLYTASKAGWRYLRYLPVIFAALHFSYGLGFLRGLLKFYNRWQDRG
jgi:hypothetical protein